jgi:hypothetical protein
MYKKVAEKLAKELKGHAVGGWMVGNYINCGKTALVCLHGRNQGRES